MPTSINNGTGSGRESFESCWHEPSKTLLSKFYP